MRPMRIRRHAADIRMLHTWARKYVCSVYCDDDLVEGFLRVATSLFSSVSVAAATDGATRTASSFLMDRKFQHEKILFQ